MTPFREWKKAFESDLESIVFELKDVIERPALIVLSGEVGSGKTTFIRKFVSGFTGVSNNSSIPGAQSPSYSIIHEAGEAAHADFYRIENPDEITHLEIGLYLEDKEFFLVEWGKPYVRELERILYEEYTFYELKISINEQLDSIDQVPSRNFFLYKL